MFFFGFFFLQFLKFFNNYKCQITSRNFDFRQYLRISIYKALIYNICFNLYSFFHFHSPLIKIPEKNIINIPVMYFCSLVIMIVHPDPVPFVQNQMQSLVTEDIWQSLRKTQQMNIIVWVIHQGTRYAVQAVVRGSTYVVG